MNTSSKTSYLAAVYLDRDGVVIEDAHYLSDPAQVRLLPGAAEAIAALNRALMAVVIVTNQSGVARGFFSEDAVHAVHGRLSHLLALKDARVDAFYHCPHLESAAVPAYRNVCACRKPKPGMVVRARVELGLMNLPSFMVGDRASDMRLAQAVGASALLVRTGYGREEEAGLRASEAPPDRIFDDLAEAADWIVG